MTFLKGNRSELNTTVDQYIERQKSPQKEICRELRTIIQKTIPGVYEEMYLGVPWFEDKVYIVALQDHVNIGFSLRALSKEMQTELEGNGKTMKHITIGSLKEIVTPQQ
ncbi:MAG: DUF1801 domain-containing protein [Ignavibacteriales bacterium]|nr:DUF1801 domain-containing protein [Ignavibacteriales bacterium]